MSFTVTVCHFSSNQCHHASNQNHFSVNRCQFLGSVTPDVGYDCGSMSSRYSSSLHGSMLLRRGSIGFAVAYGWWRHLILCVIKPWDGEQWGEITLTKNWECKRLWEPSTIYKPANNLLSSLANPTSLNPSNKKVIGSI